MNDQDLTELYAYAEEVASAYVDAALWATTDEDTEGDCLDARYTEADLSSEALAQVRATVALFIRDNWANLVETAKFPQEWDGYTIGGQNGHDLFLSRVGAGVGFWDRGYPKEVGDALSKAADDLGSVWPYAGDDGKVYFG